MTISQLTIVKLCLINLDEMHWNAFKRFCKAQDPLEKVHLEITPMLAKEVYDVTS